MSFGVGNIFANNCECQRVLAENWIPGAIAGKSWRERRSDGEEKEDGLLGVDSVFKS